MKAILVLVVAFAVLFAPMVGAARVEAQGFFDGNSAIGRVLGAGAIGAGAGAVGGMILGKGVGPAKGALAGAGIGAVVQGLLEITDNVPISCPQGTTYVQRPDGTLACIGAGQVYQAAPPVVMIPGGGYGGWYCGPSGAWSDGFIEGRTHARVDAMYRAWQWEEEVRRQQAIADERAWRSGYRAGRH